MNTFVNGQNKALSKKSSIRSTISYSKKIRQYKSTAVMKKNKK